MSKQTTPLYKWRECLRLAVAVGINGHLAVGINDWFVDAASNFFGLSDQGSKMDSRKNECDFSRTSAAMLDIFDNF